MRFCDLKVGDEFVFSASDLTTPEWFKRKTRFDRAIYTCDGSPVSDVDLAEETVVLVPPAPEETYEIVDRPVGADRPELLRSVSGVRFKHFLDSKTGRVAATIVTQPLDNVSPGLVAVACAIAHPSDVASRRGGRTAALKKLRDGDFVAMSEDALKIGIASRSVLNRFGAGRLIRRVRAREPFILVRAKTTGRVNPFDLTDS